MSADTFTENGCPSFSTTGNARVNLFFKLTRDVHKNDNFIHWIEESLQESKLDTLKILFNARDCRGGKGDRFSFIRAISYLIEEHPELITLDNIKLIPEYGRYQDWIEIWHHIDLNNIRNSSIHKNIEYYKKIVTKIICKQLQEDVDNMLNNKSVSLLAKWLPSENKYWNNRTKILHNICIELFNLKEKEPTTYHYKVLRTKYISPLRNYINVVEKKMCLNEWKSIEYSEVPSIAMNRLKKAFERHAPDEFRKWIIDVKAGRSKIQSKMLYPHDLVRQYLHNTVHEPDDIIEEQWKKIVKNIEAMGTFSDSIVLSDVSASMEGTPMEVSIALGILISSIIDRPFKNNLITFETYPNFHIIPDTCSTLYSKVQNLRHHMRWGGSTNINKVFELLLNHAKLYHLNEESMPKHIYILSDMQFDQANDNNLTQFDNIKIKYNKAGYQMPQIIFWNLRSDDISNFPVINNIPNVAMVSGYSPSILNTILESKELSPYIIMRQVIDSPRYEKIKII